MKVLFSITYYTPYVSGLTLYVKRLAEALAEKSNQVSVISFQHEEGLPSEEKINNIRVVRVKPLFKISKGFVSLGWLTKCFREVRKHETVIINLPQFEGVTAALLGKIFGKKVISVYHCEVVLPRGFSNRIINWLLNRSNKISLALSDTVVTYTEDFASHSKILLPYLKKTKYVYPPIPLPKIDKRVQKMIMEKIGKTDYVIGVAARLAAEKGIEYLLEAIPLIQNVIARNEATKQSRGGSSRPAMAGLAMTYSPFKIIIAGSLDPVGETSYKKKILQLVEKYRDYIIFLGELKEEEMGAFYSLLDVLVLPSINSTEAFGMVQVEAMMMGVPVVATNLPGVRVPIQKTGMGTVVPVKNSQKLAEAIVEVLKNKKEYLKDKEIVKREFLFSKTVDFYGQLLT